MVKELSKPAAASKIEKNKVDFILQGGSVPTNSDVRGERDDVRFQMIMPRELVNIIDTKRKQRMGNVSRTLWIIEILEEAIKRI